MFPIGDWNALDGTARWQKVDMWLRYAIEDYYKIKYSVKGGIEQPVFIDLIIKLTICRAYALNSIHKVVTAKNVLSFAEKMINMLKSNQHPLRIIGAEKSNKNEVEMRQEAPVIPIDILEQKYLMHKGFLEISRNNKVQAKRLFVKAINAG